MKLNEKGSVTMIVVVTVFFIVILLSSFLIYMSARRRAQLEETKKISEAYDGDMDDIYNKLTNENDEPSAEAALFDTSYGRIDVIWINTDNEIIDNPCAPQIYYDNESLTPIKWEGTKEVETTDKDGTWYNYVAKQGLEDNLSSKWANAKDKNGNYFVWIPRYAYRITYYKDDTSTIPTGYCDGRGIVDSKGNVKYPLDEGIETVEKNGVSYIVHPAFMDDTASTFSHGGWDSDLTGIWVGKYKASHSDASQSSEGTNIEIKIKPNVVCWRNIRIDDAYTYSYNYSRAADSHLTKNSEWGAVAYLTHSQYGRNGHEIDVNNSSNYITGNGGGSPNASSAPGITNAYDSSNGQKASSTGNIYGIYDLSGGAYEYVAAYDNASDNLKYGESFAVKGGKSTKYSTAYTNGTSITSGMKIYQICKIGDATKEVFVKEEKNWLNDHSNLVHLTYPFFRRSGYYNNESMAGIFFSSYGNGYIDNDYTFRLVFAG